MKIVKRISSIIFSLLLFASFNVMVFADASGYNQKLAALKDIIETVNEEYGLNYRWPTEQEMSITGANKNQILSVDIEEFKDELIKAAQRACIQEYQVQSRQKQANHVISAKKNLFGMLSVDDTQTGYKRATKTKDGAVVTIAGKTYQYNGAWKWESTLDTVSSAMDYDNNTQRFDMKSYSYQMIDAKRTCALTLQGTMHDHVLMFWIPRDGTVYVEFSAGAY